MAIGLRKAEYTTLQTSLAGFHPGITAWSGTGVLREPVSLGQCQHVFCLSCVGDCVGTKCPVCHMPAWVQDAHINRQLDHIIQLCRQLRHLLGMDTSDSTEGMSTPTESDFGKKCKKEQIKMWFSPRSRKIRCTLNKSQPESKSNDLCQDTSSVYDFLPSPPHEKPSKPTRKPTQRQSKKMKRKCLADINKVWSFEKPEQKGVEEKTPKEKCVTICSQPLVLCTPEPNSPEETLHFFSVKTADDRKNLESVEVLPQVKVSEKKDNSAVVCPAQVSKEKKCATETSLPIENETTPLKRGREQPRLPVTSQSKRPRTERSSTEKSVRQVDCSEDLPQGYPISPTTDKTPVQVSSSGSKVTDTGVKTRSSTVFQAINSRSLSKCPSTPSKLKTCNQVGIPHSPSVLKSPGGNTIARRNYKGETLLHLASIKGDLATVEQLLKNGADPNVKDNAGWTPLHEACNHGHKEVVELLLQFKALVNTTGYQNDSPLHDAAKNGHVSIAELLLLHGASCDAVNIFGLRPVDYAEGEKMKSVLMLPVKNQSLSLNQSSEVLSSSQPRDGPLGILGSSLSSKQQKLLDQLATVLKARRYTEFNSRVTHLVIPDVPMPSTVKCMMAVLTGCWVLKFEWVQACLQTTVREPEEKYEIQGGPQRGRLNREQLLPHLFDGCYFYFLGSFKHHQKSDLMELVKAAGGQILVRKPKPDSDVTQTINTVAYHAAPTSDQRFCTQYVIYDVSSQFKPEKINQGKVWMAPSSWLIDCVMSFQLLPVK
ncbi:PREDICTED: LOW QUALITY PROTEIN: BRCA1-associated RING domain protein 1 [Chaetura pelagica]|uniref:LOW QUALITY PROTEIN: BRCA1-associated RING domain protein 1 n=1 Tax=Chaetura pelagica TaxID=8897 RepID=UPI0005236D0F|nr:PREDICTED: LOW QUALITY PROTEIN: BRCA1-associated RING domain protein 1 [Chaetura pelagica]